ncbi:MAG: SpoVG family protein [Lachnospiraceae bacterium]
MNIYVKINKKFDDEKSLKAFATLFIDKQLAITGIRVLDGKNGLYVMMPSRMNPNGEYQDVCFPITAKMRKDITEAVLQAYNEQ